MAQINRPFQVVPESSQTLAVTGTSQALTLTNPIGTRSLRIYNSGAGIVYFRYNAAAVVATSTPVAPGSVEVFVLPNDVTTVNFIASGVGNTVFITLGEGT